MQHDHFRQFLPFPFDWGCGVSLPLVTKMMSEAKWNPLLLPFATCYHRVHSYLEARSHIVTHSLYYGPYGLMATSNQNVITASGNPLYQKSVAGMIPDTSYILKRESSTSFLPLRAHIQTLVPISPTKFDSCVLHTLPTLWVHHFYSPNELTWTTIELPREVDEGQIAPLQVITFI